MTDEVENLLAAALCYAKQGLSVFPCVNKPGDDKHKKPHTRHGYCDATTHPATISKWWSKWPNALIGVPTGDKSGFAVLDLDVKKGKDGFAQVPDWERRSPVIARTRSGGAHIYFRAAGAPGCTSDQIALGVDTRGEGGYVIVPPSPGYSWVNGSDFSALPPWPEDLRPPERAVERRPAKNPEADSRLIAAALTVIPNDDLGWDDWNRIGMAIWRATEGSDEGLAAFDAWSRKSKKYDADATADRWRHYFRSPPDEIGAGTLFHEAEEANSGWRKDYDAEWGDERLAQMNAKYSVVIDGGKTRVLWFDSHTQARGHRRLVPIFMSFGDFHNFHKNEKLLIDGKPVPLGGWWTSHPQRRSYRGLTFRPDINEEVVDGRLNLWKGWGVAPKPGDWPLMQQHVKEVVAAGDEDAATYIENWLAWAVQHPAERAEVALVLLGGRGTGKGTLGNAMCRMFGQHASHISSPKHLAGNFNAHLRDACFLFSDEAWWPGDRSVEGNVKRLITEPTLLIEPKGRDTLVVENMLHVMMASNSDWVVSAGERERRYAIFQASEHKRQDRSWFGPLYEQLEAGGYSAMLYDLLHRDLGDWHPRCVPMTDALRKQQERSLEPLDAWVLKFFEAGMLPDGLGVDRPNRALSRSTPDVDGRNPRNGLYDLAREQPALRHMDEQVLARHLKDWGCMPWRNNRVRGWEFPPLSECRAQWEEKYPGWAWQHPDLTEWVEDQNIGSLFSAASRS